MKNWKEFEEKIVKKRKYPYKNDIELWNDIISFLNFKLPIKMKLSSVLNNYPNLSIKYLEHCNNFEIIKTSNKYGMEKFRIDSKMKNTEERLLPQSELTVSDKKIIQDFIQFKNSILQLNNYKEKHRFNLILNKHFNFMFYCKNLFSTGFMLVYYNLMITKKTEYRLEIISFYSSVVKVLNGEILNMFECEKSLHNKEEYTKLQQENKILRETILSIRQQLKIMEKQIQEI